MAVYSEAILVAILSIFLFLALGAAIVMVALSMRKPSNVLLGIAAGLLVFSVIVVAVTPVNVPTIVGLFLALLGAALAVIGGDPVTRRVLAIATQGTVREGSAGGILLRADSSSAFGSPAVNDASNARVHEVMRGGTTIGYVERISVVVAIIAGFPEALAIIVAIKGVGRFSELAEPESRERFIIGTMTSLLWACIVGALVHLSIW